MEGKSQILGSRRGRVLDERGFALSAVILVMLLSMTLGAASIVHTSLDVRGSGHYVTGNQAMYSAESGILHALSTVNEAGVIDFKADVVDRWGTIFGYGSKTFPADPRAAYEVVITADAAAPKDGGTITVTGTAPLRARRVVQITLAKDQFVGAPGAIYLASDDTTMDFTGNAFAVDGNDHDRFGAPVADSVTKPGISTRTDPVAQGVIDALSSVQMDNVLGEGFSSDPATPSVLNTGGPDVADLDQFVTDLLSTLEAVIGDGPTTLESDPVASDNTDNSALLAAAPVHALYDGTTYSKIATVDGDLYTIDGVEYLESTQSTWSGNDTLGTLTNPQITHIATDEARLLGNASGAGILIVDGSLTIRGTFDFVGWVIVRGTTTVDSETVEGETSLLGNATLTGSLWTSQLNVQLGGSMIVDYCQECLQLIDGVSVGNTNAVPRPMRIVSWQESD